LRPWASSGSGPVDLIYRRAGSLDPDVAEILTPLSAVRLQAMFAATEAGAIIAPPTPAFYTDPETIGDLIDHTVGCVRELGEIENLLVHRWASFSKMRSDRWPKTVISRINATVERAAGRLGNKDSGGPKTKRP
jgi:hypothetical protein